MRIGDKVLFVGQEYNVAKIFKYDEIFKDKELTIEDIIECPCDDRKMDKLKFNGIEGYYKAVFFNKT